MGFFDRLAEREGCLLAPPPAAPAGAPGGGEARHVFGSDTWLPIPSLAGVPVGPDTVSAFGCYYAGVYVLSSDLASIPFQVLRRGEGGTRLVDESHWLHDVVFHGPNEEMSAQGYFQAIMWHLLTRGNSYSKILRDAYLRPVGLKLIEPDLVNPKRTPRPERKLWYDIDGEAVLPRDVVHFANVGYDGVVGVSPIQHARETLGLAIATEKTAAAYYGNGIHPGGVVTYPQAYDETRAKNARDQLVNVHQGPFNAHKFMQLWGGATFTATTIAAADAEYLASRQFNVEEICRLINLPPTKLQKWDRATYANIEEANANYYQSSLLPWVRRIETELNRKLLTRVERRTISVVHDTASTLRGRMLDDANRDKILLDEGVVNRNEVRAKHGWGPIKGGDVYLVPLNMAPLDKVAEASIETLKGVKADPATPAPAKAPTPEGDSDTIDVATSEADGDVVEAMRAVFAQVARRMVTRECGVIRKALKKGDLAEALSSLDAHYKGEAEVLADAYGPALRALGLVKGRKFDAEAFARTLVANARDEIRERAEAPETLAQLARMADAWESSKAHIITEAAIRS